MPCSPSNETCSESLSSLGMKPLGIFMNKKTVAAISAREMASVTGRYRSVHRSDLS